MISELFNKNLALETERLTLRPLCESDAEKMFEIFSDELVMRYYDLKPFKNFSQAVEQVKLFMVGLKERSMIRWGIELKETGELIGTCGFHCINEKSKKAEIGYELNRKHWGMGLMTEALKSVIEFVFTQTDINRIEAFVEIPNTASQRLLDKIGFTKEGILRSYEMCRGNLIDITIWGYLRSDGNF